VLRKQHLSVLFAVSFFVAIPAARNAHAQGDVSPAEHCMGYFHSYVTGILETPACDEREYESVIHSSYCSAAIKQEAQKAHAVCLATRAGKRDYEDCNQTADIKRCLSGCTHIINDQTQSLADRVSAHVQSGNAYVLKKDYILAIDQYDRAIKLDSRSALAYAARAIANWKSADRNRDSDPVSEWQDRKRAVADYRQATSINADGMGELVTLNPDLKKISAAAQRPAPPRPQGEPKAFYE
jgi:tetratricopeptide (TPR) repeat protein